jgi:hypothetical protein
MTLRFARALPLIAAVVVVLLSTTTTSTQQPPQAPPAGGAVPQAGAQGAPRGGGGGFRQPDPIDFNEHDGWTSLFDGRTLNGWSGDDNWKVEDGAITIETTCEKPTGTVYLVWQGGEAADFELKLEMKGTGNINGGVQYRGWIVAPQAPGATAPGGAPAAGQAAAQGGGRPGGAGGPGAGGRGQQGPCPSGAPRGTPPSRESEAKWNMAGAQYDFDAGNRYTGQFYEQATGRGIIAWKGQVVRTEAGRSPRLLATLGDAASIDSIYKPNDWNELHVIAIGNQMTHLLNGRVISILIDDDPARLHKSGILGLEVEATGKLFVRNVWLKRMQF